jgi:hypothetical protein
VNLSDDLKCLIFGHPDRPKVCAGFKPEVEICGNSIEEAESNFRWMLE